jgi:hypothetical protein
VLERFTSATPDQLLHIYLNDHRTGAVVAHALAVRARGANTGNEFGEYLDDFVPALEDDIEQLDAVFDRCEIARDHLKLGAARIGAELGRFKLNGRITDYSPLSRVVEFEALTVGVLGKRKMWKTIAALPPEHPATSAVDAPQLIERAEAQATQLEELAQRAAALAFPARSATAGRADVG